MPQKGAVQRAPAGEVGQLFGLGLLLALRPGDDCRVFKLDQLLLAQAFQRLERLSSAVCASEL